MSRQPFRISSALKSIVGRDLITNDNVAIFELVKNSIDAGAGRIDIVFELDEESEKCIYIIDNGKGMSRLDIDNKWLYLGYSAKATNEEDETARTYAGNKGVGRFSCDRLGSSLVLQTQKTDKKIVNQVEVNWEDFEHDSHVEFANINVEISKVKNFDTPEQIAPPKQGTVLKITNLRDPESWNRKKIQQLKRQLFKLSDPFGDRSLKHRIYLHCFAEEHRDKIATQKEQAGKSGDMLINGVVKNNLAELISTKTTSVHTKVSGKYFITELCDRGELIYKIRTKVGADSVSLQGIKFELSIYFMNKSAKSFFTKTMGIRPIVYGSIFLFKNGFRIYPVGDESDDYWKINRRKQQGQRRYLGPRDVIGKVSIVTNSPLYRESSSRDKGLIENKAVLAISNRVMDSLKMLEAYVVDITWQDKLDKTEDTAKRMYIDSNRSKVISLVQNLTKTNDIELLEYNRDIVNILEEKSHHFENTLSELRDMAESLADESLIRRVRKAEKLLVRIKADEKEAREFADKESQAREEAERLAKEAEIATEKAKASLTEEISRNQFLVSTTSRDKEQLEHFIHQISYFSSKNRRIILNLLKFTKHARDEQTKIIRNKLMDLQRGVEKTVSTSRYLTSANFRLDSGKTHGDLIAFIYQHLTIMIKGYITGIQVQVHVHQSCKKIEFEKTFSPIEFGMLFDNLIWNSKKNRASKVVVSLSHKNGFLNVSVCDDGQGISPLIDIPDTIFDKGVTRTNGSGLGLYFVKQTVEKMGGTVSYIPQSKGVGGFCLEIRFQ